MKQGVKNAFESVLNGFITFILSPIYPIFWLYALIICLNKWAAKHIKENDDEMNFSF